MSISPEILGHLKSVPLFAGVPNDLLIQHFNSSKRIALTAGTTFLSPGDSNENVYIILSGRMRICHRKADDPVAIFGAGDSVGELFILCGSKVFDYFIADTDCEMLYVDHAAIWSLVNGSHQAARNMLNILSSDSPLNKHSNREIENQNGYAALNQVDELTGLYNAQWMLKMFDRQILRCAKTHSQATLMMVSIDQFKNYNQCHGPLGGDLALRTIAQTILTCLRPNDQAARYHDKVFAVFMPNTMLEEANKAGQRLLKHASDAVIVTPSGDALPHVTISIGLAEVKTENTLQQMIEQAAEALQRAKQAGRNCISN